MKIGIVGCGLMGQKRAKSIYKPHTITWLADVELDRTKILAKSISNKTKVTSNWKEVITANDVDAVIVCTNHETLATITLGAIEAGKHVLVEKPAARNVEEIDQIISAANEKNVVVKVGFNHRTHPAFQKAKMISDSGVIGPLMFIRGRYGHGGRIGFDKEWRTRPEISGGGELIDQGSHLIDLSRWFLGDFIHISGFLSIYYWNINVEDNSFIVLRTASNQIAWLHASWTEWKNLFSFEIYGREGKLHIEGLGGSYGTERLYFYKMLPELGPPETTIWEYPFPDNSWGVEFDEFVHAIREKRIPCGNLADARAVLDIIEKIYRNNKISEQV